MIRRLWQESGRGAAIDPTKYSPVTSPNRIRSFGFAVAGCAYMLRHQKNTRIMIAATAVALGIALWLRVDGTKSALLILAIASVWLTEFINAAIEACVNLASSEHHPMAKVAKDVGAGAVVVAVVAAAIVGFLILGPPLIDKLAAASSGNTPNG